MNPKRTWCLLACVLILGTAVSATAQVPDLELSVANTVYHTSSDPALTGGLPPGQDGTETLSLYSLPSSCAPVTGNALTEMLAPGSVIQDGTINMILRDSLGNPIPNFPRCDMWIDSADRGMVSCDHFDANCCADMPTDAQGGTLWQLPLRAGCQSSTLCIVFINGAALTSNNGLDVWFNSADFNGDCLVNLTDAGFFTSYLGTTTYDADFNFDGIVNVSDAGPMAEAF